VVPSATNGGDSRSQSLVGHSRGEAGVVHGENGTGVVVLARGEEKAAVDPCEADLTRASVPQKGRFEY